MFSARPHQNESDTLAGSLDKPGTYDLVLLVRQDVGGLSHETRIDMPKMITVK